MKITLLNKFRRRTKPHGTDLERQLAIAKSRMPSDILEAHSHCAQHRDEILGSELCGCFYCLETYRPSEITEWIVKGTCAICPRCEIDAVLGDKSGYPMTKKFLTEMHKYWFGK